MTILVGVLCSDGVVIGADSAVTFTHGDYRTIEQIASMKVCVIGGRVILAITGSVGHGQRLRRILEETVKEGSKFYDGDAVKIARDIGRNAKSDFDGTRTPPGVVGALVAFKPGGGRTALCEFDLNHFQPELKTDRIWYCSMGSGQPIVDPMLGLIRRVFWEKGPPNCQGGTFAATWALMHAVRLNPGGINFPLQIAVLRDDPPDGEPAVIELDQGAIGQHLGHVDGLEKYISEYPEYHMSNPNAPRIPTLGKSPVERTADAPPPATRPK